MAFTPFKKKAPAENEAVDNPAEEAAESPAQEKAEEAKPATPPFKIGKKPLKQAASDVKKMSKADKFAKIAQAAKISK